MLASQKEDVKFRPNISQFYGLKIDVFIEHITVEYRCFKIAKCWVVFFLKNHNRVSNLSANCREKIPSAEIDNIVFFKHNKNNEKVASSKNHPSNLSFSSWDNNPLI